jgi:Na+/proline symporter
MWYGAMGTWQILLFALIAIKTKANAPGAHTFPEIVLARHGKVAHGELDLDSASNWRGVWSCFWIFGMLFRVLDFLVSISSNLRY